MSGDSLRRGFEWIFEGISDVIPRPPALPSLTLLTHLRPPESFADAEEFVLRADEEVAVGGGDAAAAA